MFRYILVCWSWVVTSEIVQEWKRKNIFALVVLSVSMMLTNDGLGWEERALNVFHLNDVRSQWKKKALLMLFTCLLYYVTGHRLSYRLIILSSPQTIYHFFFFVFPCHFSLRLRFFAFILLLNGIFAFSFRCVFEAKHISCVEVCERVCVRLCISDLRNSKIHQLKHRIQHEFQ